MRCRVYGAKSQCAVECVGLRKRPHGGPRDKAADRGRSISLGSKPISGDSDNLKELRPPRWSTHLLASLSSW